MKEVTKYDTGKTPVGQMVKDFSASLEEVARVWEYGTRKYAKSNWKHLENAENRYTDAMLRHLLQEEKELLDKETELLHAAHVAWNALARLYFIVNQLEDK